MTLDVIFAVFWLGFFAAGAVTLIRVLPFIIPLLDRGLKPWACDRCMCFWTTLFGVAGIPSFANDVLHYPLSHKVFLLAGPASYALALLVLRSITEHIGPPPGFNMPELVDLDTPEVGGKVYTPPFSDPPPAH